MRKDKERERERAGGREERAVMIKFNIVSFTMLLHPVSCRHILLHHRSCWWCHSDPIAADNLEHVCYSLTQE